MCSLNLCLKIYIESERRKKGERDATFNSYNNYIQSACENLFKSLKGSKPYICTLYLWKKNEIDNRVPTLDLFSSARPGVSVSGGNAMVT